MTKEFILLDRDGVINEDRSKSVLSSDEFVLLPFAAEAIALANRKGYGVLVITNQACVGRGELASDELYAIHRYMCKLIEMAGGRIEEIYVCPYTDADRCDCRKPAPGLISRAHAKYGFDPGGTWLVGDAPLDIDAAIAAGCRPALVRTGKGAGISVAPGIPVFRDLMHFSEQLRQLT